MKTLSILLLSVLHASYAGHIHFEGYWEGRDAQVIKEHHYDASLAKALSEFFKQEQAKTLVDFGCGLGEYMKELQQEGFYCEGYDGNPDTPVLTNGLAKILDLSKPFDLEMRFDWALCLEVGEHIPSCYESTLLDNLCRHNTKGIVLSWAVEGQGGWGHVNEKSNHTIKEQMLRRGYINDTFSENLLREEASLHWFKNTIMVFRNHL